MENDRYGGAIRNVSPQESRRAREIQEVRELLARKEIELKARIRQTRRVPKERQL